MDVYYFVRRRLLLPTILDMLALKGGEQILDVGCGKGIITIELARRGAIVTGIDIDPVSLQIAKQKHSHNNITYINCNVVDYKVHRELDICLLSLVLNEIEEYRAVLFKVCTFSQRILLIVPHPCFQLSRTQWMAMKSVTFDKPVMCFTVSRYCKHNSFEKLLPNGRVVREYHRPLSDYCKALWKGGFCIELIEEPMLSREDAKYGGLLFHHAFFFPKFVFILARRSQI